MVVIINGKTENPSNGNCRLIPTQNTDRRKKKRNRIQTRNLISSEKKNYLNYTKCWCHNRIY